MFSLSKLSPSITDMIRFDHAQVLVSFHQYTGSARTSVKKALADTLCDALEIHATLEEEIFYPVLRLLDNSEVLQQSVPAHMEMHRLIGELRATRVTDGRHDDLVHELIRDVLHHMADEETVLLPQAERLLGQDRLNELGAQMTSRRLALLKPKAGKLARNAAVGFSGSTTAIVVGLAGALMAARYVSKHAPELGTRH